MKVTVKQLIDSLKNHDENKYVEIAVMQYNKRYPAFYAAPNSSIVSSSERTFATCENGTTVRLEISLPRDKDTFSIISTRKIK